MDQDGTPHQRRRVDTWGHAYRLPTERPCPRTTRAAKLRLHDPPGRDSQEAAVYASVRGIPRPVGRVAVVAALTPITRLPPVGLGAVESRSTSASPLLLSPGKGSPRLELPSVARREKRRSVTERASGASALWQPSRPAVLLDVFVLPDALVDPPLGSRRVNLAAGPPPPAGSRTDQATSGLLAIAERGTQQRGQDAPLTVEHVVVPGHGDRESLARQMPELRVRAEPVASVTPHGTVVV